MSWICETDKKISDKQVLEKMCIFHNTTKGTYPHIGDRGEILYLCDECEKIIPFMEDDVTEWCTNWSPTRTGRCIMLKKKVSNQISIYEI